MRRSFVLAALLLIALTAAAREPSLSVRITGTSSVIEGNQGITQFPLVIGLSNPQQDPVTATYTTVDGTATVADNDYLPKSGMIVIDIGQTESQPIVLEIVGDRRVEGNETFQVVVDFQTDNIQDPPPFTITIVNDDTPSVTVADARVTEGNSGTTAMAFDVTLSSAASVPVQATFQTDPGTATAGTDYQSAQGTITFAPGETRKTVTVLVNGDTVFESDETLTLTVTPVGGAKVTATGTIVNDDSLGPARLDVVSGNNQQGRLGQRLPQPLVVQLVNANNGGVAGFPVQWRVSRGQASLDSTSATTDAQGRASTNVTLNSVGVVEVTATAGGFTAVFTLGAATSFEQRAQGPVAVPVARALDTICARNEVTFAEACRALSLLPDG